MKEDLAHVIMNPVRQRIVQHLIFNGRATVADLARALDDVPRASLYRHVNRLLEAGCIRVVEKKRARGALERTYALAEELPGAADARDAEQLVQSMLSSLQLAFARYFSRSSANPERDGVGVSSSTLMLTDDEYREFLTRIGEVYRDYVGNGGGAGRRARNILWISIPSENEEEEKYAED